MTKIIFFYGKDCPHCKVMMPYVERLKKEGIKIIKLEVWNNHKNTEKMRSFKDIIIPECDGTLCVPAFINEKTNKAFCGESTYLKLKNWIKDNEKTK